MRPEDQNLVHSIGDNILRKMALISELSEIFVTWDNYFQSHGKHLTSICQLRHHHPITKKAA